MLRRVGILTVCAFMTLSAATALSGPVRADPVGQEPPPAPLPVIMPTASSWQPQFPYPYDQSRRYVTDADISAQREMCQWYDAQYEELMRQIDRFNIKLISRNGNWNIDDIPAHANALVANIDQSVGFLTPRAQALTQRRDFAGDNFFPLYQGESFYLLWQHLSNVGNGLRARQPAWFTGPSMRRVQYWGSRINRSHVCR